MISVLRPVLRLVGRGASCGVGVRAPCPKGWVFCVPCRAWRPVAMHRSCLLTSAPVLALPRWPGTDCGRTAERAGPRVDVASRGTAVFADIPEDVPPGSSCPLQTRVLFFLPFRRLCGIQTDSSKMCCDSPVKSSGPEKVFVWSFKIRNSIFWQVEGYSDRLVPAGLVVAACSFRGVGPFHLKRRTGV